MIHSVPFLFCWGVKPPSRFKGRLGKKEERGELILQCTLWDCKFFENSKFLPIGAKFILNVVYKFTSRLFFQQFDRAEDFCMPKAVNTVSK